MVIFHVRFFFSPSFSSSSFIQNKHVVFLVKSSALGRLSGKCKMLKEIHRNKSVFLHLVTFLSFSVCSNHSARQTNRKLEGSNSFSFVVFSSLTTLQTLKKKAVHWVMLATAWRTNEQFWWFFLDNNESTKNLMIDTSELNTKIFNTDRIMPTSHFRRKVICSCVIKEYYVDISMDHYDCHQLCKGQSMTLVSYEHARFHDHHPLEKAFESNVLFCCSIQHSHSYWTCCLVDVSFVNRISKRTKIRYQCPSIEKKRERDIYYSPFA